MLHECLFVCEERWGKRGKVDCWLFIESWKIWKLIVCFMWIVDANCCLLFVVCLWGKEERRKRGKEEKRERGKEGKKGGDILWLKWELGEEEDTIQIVSSPWNWKSLWQPSSETCSAISKTWSRHPRDMRQDLLAWIMWEKHHGPGLNDRRQHLPKFTVSLISPHPPKQSAIKWTFFWKYSARW